MFACFVLPYSRCLGLILLSDCFLLIGLVDVLICSLAGGFVWVCDFGWIWVCLLRFVWICTLGLFGFAACEFVGLLVAACVFVCGVFDWNWCSLVFVMC